MRTLGVDLSSQPKKTAACIIKWSPNEATVTELRVRCTDDDILALAKDCDAIGIDAPFGWPLPLIDFVSADPAPADKLRKPLSPAELKLLQTNLRYRLTDLYVWDTVGIAPLAVGADKIALPAMRCSELLDLLHVSDRSGDGRVYEVYPAAALRTWGFTFAGIKGHDGNPILTKLCNELSARIPHLGFADDGALDKCKEDNDALDALVSSLVARAAKCGLTTPPSQHVKEVAQREGWIAVPCSGSLEELVDANACAPSGG